MISLTTLQFPPAPWSWMLTIGLRSPSSLPPRPAGQPQPDRPGEALDDRLSELVPVVGGSVGRVDPDRKGGGEVARVGKGRVLPGEPVAGDPQVPDAVGGRPRDDEPPPPRGLDVPDPPSRSRFRPGEWGDAAREVVRLRREDEVIGGGGAPHP